MLDLRERHDDAAAVFVRRMKEKGGARAVAIFEGDGFHAIRSLEPLHLPGEPEDLRWHVSVSREERLPTWAEFAEAVHLIRPGVPFCLPLPPKSWWINLHPYTLHAHEIKDHNLVGLWRDQRSGHTPS